MGFGGLVAALIFCIAGGVTTLILSVIFLATSKTKNALISSVFFVMFLASGILCIIEITGRVKNEMSYITDKMNKNKDPFSDWRDSTDKKADHKKGPLHDTLVSYIPKEAKDSVDNDYWEHDHHGRSYLPIVYPYQLEADASLDEGAKIICFARSNCRISEVTIVPENITLFNFDRHFILFKKDNTVKGRNRNLSEPDVLYVLFDIRTGSSRSFINESQLLQEAGKAGYTGENELMDLDQYEDKL
jgi:hypothetical protein